MKFHETDIAQLGKYATYGDFVTRYLVRLQDDRILFVNGNAQTKDAQHWLRRVMRSLQVGAPTRNAPIREAWKDNF